MSRCLEAWDFYRVRVSMVRVDFGVRAMSGVSMVQGFWNLGWVSAMVDFKLRYMRWWGSRVLVFYALRCREARCGESQPTPNPLRD